MKGEPPRYVIGYEHSQRYAELLAQHGGDRDTIDPLDYWETEEARSLVGAIAMARARERVHRVVVTVYERVGMVARHPYPDHPSFTDWDWHDEVAIGDVTDGVWTRY